MGTWQDFMHQWSLDVEGRQVEQTVTRNIRTCGVLGPVPTGQTVRRRIRARITLQCVGYEKAGIGRGGVCCLVKVKASGDGHRPEMLREWYACESHVCNA